MVRGAFAQRSTDKFHCQDQAVCARACREVQECTHWSFGEGSCFLRKSDGGMEHAAGFSSGNKACAPPPLSSAWLAQRAADLPQLRACESSATCDLARAMTTWRFAIATVRRATEGKLDAATQAIVNQISQDTDAFLQQLHEDNFAPVVINNRLVFDALQGFLASQPSPSEQDLEMPGLPAPVLGNLCGPSSCY
ncbi:unnamed protein product [Effrenium voratum]|nr:unnamed protein product [Effrenium voratum]